MEQGRTPQRWACADEGTASRWRAGLRWPSSEALSLDLLRELRVEPGLSCSGAWKVETGCRTVPSGAPFGENVLRTVSL